VAVQDDICPGYVGDALIGLQLADPIATRLPFEPVDVVVDWSRTEAFGGACLPIEVIVTDGSATRIDYRVAIFTLPGLVTFTPESSGVHTVLVREMAHNRWVGTLRVPIGGSKT
jgi:hypothetical protein